VISYRLAACQKVGPEAMGVPENFCRARVPK
jgi:hypothetical protein